MCLAVLNIITYTRSGRTYITATRINLISLIVLRTVRIERYILAFVAQVNGRVPAEELFLPWAVVRRTMTITIIGTSIHYIPVVRSQAVIVVGTVLGVIEIGQTHHVTKLMAERTDTS